MEAVADSDHIAVTPKFRPIFVLGTPTVKNAVQEIDVEGAKRAFPKKDPMRNGIDRDRFGGDDSAKSPEPEHVRKEDANEYEEENAAELCECEILHGDYVLA